MWLITSHGSYFSISGNLTGTGGSTDGRLIPVFNASLFCPML